MSRTILTAQIERGNINASVIRWRPLVKIQQKNREVAFRSRIMLVLYLHADGA